jgi:hypothetical protein
MTKLSLLKYQFVFCMQIVFCSKLSRLEKRVDIMEQKMLNDAMAFRADIDDIFEKLDNVLKNSSLNYIENKPIVSSKCDASEIENVLLLVKKAVNEEKINTRKVINELRTEFHRKIERQMNQTKETDILFDKLSLVEEQINSTARETLQNEENIHDMRVTHNELNNDIQSLIKLQERNEDKAKDVDENIKRLNKRYAFLSARIDCNGKSWHSFDKSCYYVGNDVLLTWIQANEKCKLLNATLAEVETEEENAYLVELAARMTSADQLYGVYIGGSDLKREGEWIWEGSKRRIFDVFNKFKGNEPNGNRRENCLHLIRKYSWNWNDIFCETNLSYICEKTLNY